MVREPIGQVSSRANDETREEARRDIPELRWERVNRRKERPSPGTDKVLGMPPPPASGQEVVSTVLLVGVGEDERQRDYVREDRGEPGQVPLPHPKYLPGRNSYRFYKGEILFFIFH